MACSSHNSTATPRLACSRRHVAWYQFCSLGLTGVLTRYYRHRATCAAPSRPWVFLRCGSIDDIQDYIASLAVLTPFGTVLYLTPDIPAFNLDTAFLDDFDIEADGYGFGSMTICKGREECGFASRPIITIICYMLWIIEIEPYRRIVLVVLCGIEKLRSCSTIDLKATMALKLSMKGKEWSECDETSATLYPNTDESTSVLRICIGAKGKIGPERRGPTIFCGLVDLLNLVKLHRDAYYYLFCNFITIHFYFSFQGKIRYLQRYQDYFF